LAGGPIKLGNLEPTRDLNYVKDTAAGFIKAAECPQAAGQTFNLGAGREISIKELAQMILKLMNKSDLPVLTDDQRVRPAGSEVERLCADTEKAQAMLGWSPAVTLETGLTNTIEWIRENKERYRSSVYVV
jgi:nucleoside-diphosphate-sugar epimerase